MCRGNDGICIWKGNLEKEIWICEISGLHDQLGGGGGEAHLLSGKQISQRGEKVLGPEKVISSFQNGN